MKQWVTANLRFLVLYSVVFAVFSFLFSLTSWDWASHGSSQVSSPPILGSRASLIVHMLEHAALGALVALPTRKGVVVLTGAAAAMLVDADHVGTMVSLPIGTRTAHSVVFALAAFLVIFLLSRKGVFGLDIPPLVLGSLAIGSVAAHLALDALVGDGYFPLLMPFSYRHVFFGPFVGALLEIAAIALVWGTTAIRPARCYN